MRGAATPHLTPRDGEWVRMYGTNDKPHITANFNELSITNL